MNEEFLGMQSLTFLDFPPEKNQAPLPDLGLIMAWTWKPQERRSQETNGNEQKRNCPTYESLGELLGASDSRASMPNMYTQWFARQRALQIVFIAWRGQQQLMDSTAAQLHSSMCASGLSARSPVRILSTIWQRKAAMTAMNLSRHHPGPKFLIETFNMFQHRFN